MAQNLIPPTYSIEDYEKDVRTAAYENPSWRRGQTYYNVLSVTRKELATRLTLDGDRNDLDPFHRDDLIPKFLEWLYVEWYKTGNQALLLEEGDASP